MIAVKLLDMCPGGDYSLNNFPAVARLQRNPFSQRVDLARHVDDDLGSPQASPGRNLTFLPVTWCYNGELRSKPTA